MDIAVIFHGKNADSLPETAAFVVKTSAILPESRFPWARLGVVTGKAVVVLPEDLAVPGKAADGETSSLLATIKPQLHCFASAAFSFPKSKLELQRIQAIACLPQTSSMPLRHFLDIFLHVMVFLMGAGIGSFLNVVIYRLPLGISVNNPKRSYCFSCKKQIPWYHNLPLISWLVLRGKCANCGSRIAFRYFFVELLTACLLYAVFRNFSGGYVHGPWEQISIWGPVVLIFWIFTALLVSGTFIDIDHYILPHVITLGGLGVGLIASFWKPQIMGEISHWRGLLMSFLGAVVGLGLLWAVVELGKLAFGRIKQKYEQPEPWSISQPDENEAPVFQIGETVLTWHDIYTRPSDRLIIHGAGLTVNDRHFNAVRAEIKQHTLKVFSDGGEESFQLENVKMLTGRATEIVIPREAMGFGDVLLLAMIGSFLGWKAVLFTILAASVLGTLIALGPRLIGKTEWGTKLPFGPYLAGGAMIWLFWGPQILTWYMARLSGHPA